MNSDEMKLFRNLFQSLFLLNIEGLTIKQGRGSLKRVETGVGVRWLFMDDIEFNILIINELSRCSWMFLCDQSHLLAEMSTVLAGSVK